MAAHGALDGVCSEANGGGSGEADPVEPCSAILAGIDSTEPSVRVDSIGTWVSADDTALLSPPQRSLVVIGQSSRIGLFREVDSFARNWRWHFSFH